MLTENDVKNLTQIFDQKLEAQFNLFKDTLGGFAQELHGRLDRLELRMDTLESRMEKLENRMDNLEIRIIHLEDRMDKLETRMNALDKRMDTLDNRINSLDNHMDTLEGKFTSMEQYMRKRFDRLEFKVDKLHSEVAVHRVIIGEQETRIKAVERDLLSNYIIQDKPRKENK